MITITKIQGKPSMISIALNARGVGTFGQGCDRGRTNFLRFLILSLISSKGCRHPSPVLSS